jgi:sugar phosphate permease
MKLSSFKKHSLIVIIYAFVLQYMNISLVVDGMNVLYPALEKAHGWTPMKIGTATSAAVFIALIMAIVFGTLFMKFGVKKIMIPSVLLLGIDVIVMGNTSDFTTFAITMTLLQVLTVPAMVGSIAICANWFKKGRGKILGIVTIGAPAASATFVAIGTSVVLSSGYEYFYSVYGGIIIVIAIIGAVLLHDRPEDLGLFPDGAEKADYVIEPPKKTSAWTMIKMFRNKEMWLISFSWGFIFLMMTGIMANAIPRFLEVGIPIEQAISFFSIAAVLGMGASYFWGWLDDKISTPVTCAIFSLNYIVGSICFLYGSSENMALAFGGVLVIALTTGGMPNLQPSLQAWVYGREEFVPTLRYTGTIHNLFRAMAFAVSGYIVTTFGSYDVMYKIFIGLSIASLVLFLFIRKSYDPEREGAEPIPMSDNEYKSVS